MFDHDMSQDDQWLALAKYVTAVSHPIGGNPVSLIRNNVNMNLNSDDGGVPRPNEWARPSENDGVPWKHSDMKDVAYYYVYKLFEQLIQEGNLK